MKSSRPYASSREVSFFALQAVLPAAIGLMSPLLYLFAYFDIPHAVGSFADGTLVLIAFTMLMSLAQDLQQAVRPYQRKIVGRIEALLRVAAIVILSIYMLLQSSSDILLFHPPDTYSPTQVIGPWTARLGLLQWMEGTGWIEVGLSLLALWCFLIALILSASVFRAIRPHLVDGLGE